MANLNQPPKNYVGPKPTITNLDPSGARKVALQSQGDLLFDSEQLFQDLLSKKITNDFIPKPDRTLVRCFVKHVQRLFNLGYMLDTSDFLNGSSAGRPKPLKPLCLKR